MKFEAIFEQSKDIFQIFQAKTVFAENNSEIYKYVKILQVPM